MDHTVVWCVVIYCTQTSVPIQGRDHRLWNQSRKETRVAEELQQGAAMNPEGKSDSHGSYSVILTMSSSQHASLRHIKTQVSKYVLRTKGSHTYGIKETT